MLKSNAYKVGLWTSKHPFLTLFGIFLVLYLLSMVSCSEPEKPSKLAPIVAAPPDPAPKPANNGGSASEARYVCKDFITRSGYHAQDWGNSWEWSAIDNKDGTWSVGARFIGLPPGGGVTNMYVTCITRKTDGDEWRLVKLARLQ